MTPVTTVALENQVTQVTPELSPALEVTIPTRIELIKSLAKGETLQLTLGEALPLLNRRLNNDWISFKPVGKKGEKIAYINWTDITLILDYVFAYDWFVDYQVQEVNPYVVVKATVTVNGTCGLSRTVCGLGQERLDAGDGYGGPLPDANAQALRRAVTLLGLGRYLYYPHLIPPIK